MEGRGRSWFGAAGGAWSSYCTCLTGVGGSGSCTWPSAVVSAPKTQLLSSFLARSPDLL